jgi:phosphoribosylaminoimidazole (AIR) synthetase
MGVGFEFIVDPESAEDILSLIEGYGVGASIIGKCLEAQESNTLMIESGKGSYSYT